MTFTKSALSTLILITLTSSISTADNPFNGCVQVFAGKCVACSRSHLINNGRGCGPQLPSNDTCLTYNIGPSGKPRCNTCKVGYTEKMVIGESGLTCVKGTPENCEIGRNLFSNNKNHLDCIACGNGTYSVSNKTTNTNSCQKIDNPLPNCLWGSFVPSAGPTCARCVDGYALDAFSLKCVTSTQIGCWIQNQGECVACNPFEDYSIDFEGNCFKTIRQSEMDFEPLNDLVALFSS